MLYEYTPTIGNRLYNAAVATTQLLSSLFLKQSPRDLVSIDSVHGAHSLVHEDGALVSAIRIDGTRSTVHADDYTDIVLNLELMLKAYLDSGEHQFTSYFSMDTDKVEEELERIYGRDARRTAKRIGYLEEDLIDEQIKVLSEYCHLERNFFVVKTKLVNLSKNEQKQLEKLQMAQNQDGVLMSDAQALSRGVEFYINKHEALIDELINAFSNLSVISRVLSKHEFIHELRNAYDSAWTDSNWRCYLPGDKYPLRMAEEYRADYSNFGLPKLSEQIVPRMMDIKWHDMATIGDTVYAPVSVALIPEHPAPFHELLASLKAENVPFRIAFDISNNGMALFGLRESLAAMLSITPGNQNNKQITEAKKNFEKLKDAGEEIVQFRCMLCTWAYNHDADLAARRREVIAKKLQAWGNTQPEPVEGDIAESIVSSIPGLSRGNVATPLPNTLHDTCKILPFTRPASVWEKGSRVFRDTTGKIIPMQPNSDKQTSHVTLMFGPMGSSKSVNLACNNQSIVFHPDNSELPYIRQLDIGPSSRGFIQLQRSNLPESQKHLAVYERIQNTEKYQYNPFDTQLGLRFPLSNHKATLLNILALLVSPDSGGLPYEGSIDALERLVTIAYEKAADRSALLYPYEPAIDPKVDEVLAKLNFFEQHPKTRITWWDVVDFLAMNNDTHTASLAQRYAVPDLSLIIDLTSDPRLTTELSEVKTPTGESILKYINRRLRSAVNKYKILGGRTKFDISHARIVSLDLDDVTKGTGAEAEQRIALMYMLAMHILTQDIYKGDDHLNEMAGEVGTYNVDYRPYHEKHIASLQRSKKEIACDEVQRGRRVEVFNRTMVQMTLEARKWGLGITLASQLANAFPDEIKELATCTYILGAGGNRNIKNVVNEFGLNEAMEYHLTYSMRKPSKKGATFIAIFETDQGRVQQFLMNTQGPEFLWAVNSVRSDSYVRNRLERKIGEREARKLLVKRYPSGSLADEIEKRYKALGELEQAKHDNSLDDEAMIDFEEVPEHILDQIVADNLAYYNTYQLHGS